MKLRCKEGTKGGNLSNLYSVKMNDETAKKQFVKEISGVVKIEIDKPFGFIDNVFIHPSLIKKYNLINGMQWKGQAIKSYNQGKKTMGLEIIIKNGTYLDYGSFLKVDYLLGGYYNISYFYFSFTECCCFLCVYRVPKPTAVAFPIPIQ